MASIAQVYKVNEQSFSFEVLSEDESAKIKALEVALTGEGKDEMSRALIEAKREHDRYVPSIPGLAKTAEANRVELEALKARVTVLQQEIAGQNSILDIQKEVAELIKNLSTPVALVVYAVGAGPLGIAAAPVIARYIGNTASNAIDTAIGVQTSEKTEETAAEQHTATFAFSHINKRYKAILALIAQKKDSNPLLSRLVVFINNNDSLEYDLRILAEVFSKALEKGKKEEAALKKRLDERGVVRVMISAVSYAASALPTVEQLGTFAGRTADVIGKLTNLTKRAEPEAAAAEPPPDPKSKKTKTEKEEQK